MKNKKFIIGTVVAVIAVFFAVNYFNKETPKTNTVIERVNPLFLVRPHSFTKGPIDAKVTLVEFFDPECESCMEMHPIVERLYAEYSGKLRIVYRYTPFHGNSHFASAVLEEAKEQGKFEEALNILFENQPSWGSHHEPKPQLIPALMEKIGMKSKLFEREKVLAKHKAKIDIDEADGRELFVQQTPTFFVNGRKLYSIGYDSIKSVIEDELRE